MNDVLTMHDVTTIKQNINMFIVLSSLQQDPKHAKWICDDFDVLEYIEVVKDITISLTPILDNKKMRKKTPYIFAADVNQELLAVLYRGDKAEQIVNHKRYGVMYKLIFEPIFNKLIHKNASQEQVLDSMEMLSTLIKEDYDIGDVTAALSVLTRNKEKFSFKKRNTSMKDVMDTFLEEHLELEIEELNFNY